MKKFEIIFEREYGSLIGIAHIVAQSKSAAIRDFKEYSRYRDCSQIVFVREVA